MGIYLGLLPQVLLTVLAGDKDSVSLCVWVYTQIYTAIHRYRVVNNQLFTYLWFSLCHVGPGNRIDSICVYHILADSVWTTVPKMAPADLQDQPDRKDPSNMGTLCTGECWLSPVNLSCRPLFSWMSKPAPYFCLLVLCMCILVCNSIRTFKNVAKPGTSCCVNTYIPEINACWWKNLN